MSWPRLLDLAPCTLAGALLLDQRLLGSTQIALGLCQVRVRSPSNFERRALLESSRTKLGALVLDHLLGT
jgi:hypothetical protein